MDAPAGPPTVEQMLAHRAWLRRLAGALVADPNAADDLEQEVWLRALTRPPRFGAAVRSWLRTVLHRTAVDLGRGESRRRRREESVPRRDAQPAADAMAEEAESQRRVTQAVLALEDPYRDAVLQRYLWDHPVPEVARRSGVPVETVRTRLRRALALLRERLDAEHGGERSAWSAALLPGTDRSAGPPAVASTGVAALGWKAVAALCALGLGIVALAWWGWISPRRGSDPAPEGQSLGRDVGTLDADEAARVRATLAGRPPPVPVAGAGEAAPPAPAVAPAAPAGDPRADRITGRIAGRDGKAVAGARAWLDTETRLDRLAPRATDAVSAEIDEAGTFSFEALPGREYRLTVEAPGFATATVPIRSGASDVAIVLEPAASIAGQVVSKDTGLPVPRLELNARPAQSPNSTRPHLAVSGEEGRFAFGGLPEGEYVLSFGNSFEVTADAGNEYLTGTLGPVPTGSIHVRVEVVPGFAIAGVLREPSGLPSRRLFSVEASGRTERGDSEWARHRSTRSGPDGRFRIGGLPRGLYVLTLRAVTAEEGGGENPYAAARIDGIAAGTDDLVVDLREGASVRGILVADDGAPVTGAGYVWVFPQGTSAASPESVAVTVDAEGRFATPTLDAGRRYDVFASGFPGVMQGKVEGVVPGAEEVRVTCRRAGTITGRVVDADGKPVPDGVGVTASATDAASGTSAGRPGVAYTRAGGTFTLEGLGPFAFTLRAGGAASAYVTAEAATDVRVGAEDVVLKVRLGVRVRGRLEDPAGRPVGTRHLQADGVGGGNGLGCWARASAEDGRFVLAGVPEGPFTLSAYIGDEFVVLGKFETSAADDLVVVVPGR